MNTEKLKRGVVCVFLCAITFSLSAQLVSTTEWLQQQTLPIFKPGHTLPKLGQMYCGYPTMNMRIELAKHYGYGIKLNRSQKERAKEGELAKLCATNPQLYKVSMMCSNMDGIRHKPEYQWPEGSYLEGAAIPSPEMPDAAWDNYIDFVLKMLAVQMGDLPADAAATIENWTEYGVSVPGSYPKLGDKNPLILKAKGNRSWSEYISNRKGYYEKRMRDAVKAKYPNALYTAYCYGGCEHQKDSLWGWSFKHLRAGTDYPASEIYYNYFNTGFAGKWDMFTELTNARYDEIKNNSPYYYPWLSAGYKRDIAAMQGDPGQGMYVKLDRWMGFLKINYTAGMLGGVSTGEFNCDLDYKAKFPSNDPPKWLDQLSVLGHAHALFSWLEPILRNSDLLEGPYKHKWQPAQPAYEFTQDNSKVMVRRTKGKSQWLVTAWAMDGVERKVTVMIPELGDYTILARTCGTVYLVEKNANGVSSRWCDENGMFPSLTVSQLESNYRQAQNISVDSYSPIKVGEKKQLTVKYHPENPTNKSVVWTSSNPEIASVSSTGLVSRLKEGSADITATEKEMGYSAVFQLTVPIKTISLDISDKEITGIGTLQLKSSIEPENATNNTITWTSSDPTVATVNETGQVKTLKAGNAIITATSDDHGKLSASCTVTVKESPVKSIMLYDKYVEVGKSVEIRPVLNPSTAINKRVKWGESGNVKVFTITPDSITCKVQAVAVGEAAINATSLDGGFSSTATIKVVPAPPAYNYFLSPNTGSKSDFSGYMGFQFTTREEISVFALGRYSNGVLKSNHKVNLWSVTDRKLIASVTITPNSMFDGRGYQYEKLPSPLKLNNKTSYRIVSEEIAGGDKTRQLSKYGQVKSNLATIDFGITGSENEYPSTEAPTPTALVGYGAPTMYVINTTSVKGVKLNKTTAVLAVGMTEQLEATILIQSAALQPPIWKSSNTSIATVTENGLVKRLLPGKVTITAITVDGYDASCVFE